LRPRRFRTLSRKRKTCSPSNVISATTPAQPEEWKDKGNGNGNGNGRRQAYSCQESCPTGALVRVNPREYFTEVGSTIGLVFRDETHAIGRNIHKRDPLAQLWHAGGIIGTILFTFATVWALRRYGLTGASMILG
jgi:hypothetical protein